MNISVFGKAPDNLRKRVQVELITDVGILLTRVAKPYSCKGNPITHRLTVVQCKAETFTLNHSICVGFWVLELTKLHMYDFHYNHMHAKYPRPSQLRLLFTDTDSLAYAVNTDDICRDMAGDAGSRYDFSEYPFAHPLYSAINGRIEFGAHATICWYASKMLLFPLHV